MFDDEDDSDDRIKPLGPWLPDPETWATPEELHLIREGDIAREGLADEVRDLSEDAKWQLLGDAIQAERLASLRHATAICRRDLLRANICPEVPDKHWKKALKFTVSMAKRMHDLRLQGATRVRDRPWEKYREENEEEGSA